MRGCDFSMIKQRYVCSFLQFLFPPCKMSVFKVGIMLGNIMPTG